MATAVAIHFRREDHMNAIFATYEQINERKRGRANWWDEMRVCIIKDAPPLGGMWFDGDHPVWIGAFERARVKSIETAPCSTCGDKTNIAQVKADPAAIERFLAGE
jgi:hypothetical protein